MAKTISNQFKEGDWIEQPASEDETKRYLKLDYTLAKFLNGFSEKICEVVRKVELSEVKSYYSSKIKEHGESASFYQGRQNLINNYPDKFYQDSSGSSAIKHENLARAYRDLLFQLEKK